jgi:hypothetical protein
MSSGNAPIERIKAIGFRFVGEWKLDANNLRCVLQDLGSSVNVLYAFTEGDSILYIGKSVRPLQKRLYGYQKPGPTQFTNIKANKLIREALGDQRAIAVYAFADPGDRRHGEFHLNLAAGLEDSLIATLKPTWNKAGI